ncbi:MAG: hypothetical protein M3Y87_25605 [Myxococcota bacterium]|nr:hypothetical protein [Myxococcota bacterium]
MSGARVRLVGEAERRLFRADHDAGDLDARERELLAIGVAPALTRREGGVGGILRGWRSIRAART